MDRSGPPRPREDRSIVTASQLDLSVTDDGLDVRGSGDLRLNVHFDGQRIWSLMVARDGKRRGPNHFLVPWPTALKHHLDGVAHVVVRDLDGDTSLDLGECTFGSGRDRIRLFNESGQPLALDKGNRLVASFEVDDERRAKVLNGLESALAVLHESGTEAFLAFGCLLGAVREGKLIGHDNDGDISYLSAAAHPFDVVTESFALERLFLEQGWTTRRMSGGDFKVVAPSPDAAAPIDIFAGFRSGTDILVLPHVRAALPTSAILPLSVVELEGRSFASPAQPEALLEATYGSEWRVPDPSFKFRPTRSTRRKLSGWMRGERRNMRYWNDFYAMRADAVPSDPSSFARWVADREQPGRLLDIGSGTGRDSLHFAGLGFQVLGCDYSPAGVAYAQQRAAALGLDDAEFETLNLYDLRHVVARGARIARDYSPDVVYARFLVHALSDEGRRHLFLLSRSVLRRSRGRLYLEFRTERTEHEFGEHFRQFVQPDQVISELKAYGFEIDHCEDRYGLAVHKHEDPRVARIAAAMTR